MHKLLSCLLFFCIINPAHSQNPRIDSITQRINQATNNVEKADLLILRSRYLFGPQPDKSLIDAQQALAIYQAEDNGKGQADAYMQIAGAYARQNKSSLAFSFDSTANLIAQKINYKLGTALSTGNMGRDLQQAGDFEKAIDLTSKGLQLMQEHGMERETAEMYNRLGILYHRVSDLKKSISMFDEAIIVAKKYNILPSLANIYMGKANTLDAAAQYDQSIFFNLESLRIRERLKDDRGIQQAYNNLAATYNKTNQPEAALQYARMSLAACEKINNPNMTASAFNTLASTLLRMKKNDSVEYYFNRSLAIYENLKNEEGKSAIYSNLGSYYLEKEQYQQALDILLKSLAIRKQLKSVSAQASVMNTIAVVLGKMKKFKESENYLLQALSLVKNDGSYLQQSVYRALGRHYKAIGDFEKALEYESKYIDIKDTVLDKDEAMNMVRTHAAYELEKKESQVQLEKKDKELQTAMVDTKNQQLLFMLIALGLAVGLAAVFFIIYRNKKKYAATLENKNSQIEILIRELHHRVKNNLQVVSGLLSLQSNRLEDDTAKQAMEEGRTRVDAMAMVHQKLYMNKNLAAVDMKDYLENLSLSLANSFGYGRQHIETSIILPQHSMDIDMAVPIGLIVNELVTNAFKHAFKDIVDPKINISLANNSSGIMELKVADNGNGITVNKSGPGSFGMKLVHTLVEQLNGTMQQQHGNGTIYNIQIRA